jgi:hypothetical protein
MDSTELKNVSRGFCCKDDDAQDPGEQGHPVLL